MNTLIFAMAYMMEGCTVKWVSFEHWELNTSCYTSTRCVITSPMTSLLMCKKPAGGPLPRSRNAKFATRDLDRGVVKSATINTNLFLLNFGIHITYIYTTPYLQFWPPTIHSSCPARSEFGEGWPWLSDRSSHDHYHISEIRAPKWSELGHTTQNLKNSFIGILCK